VPSPTLLRRIRTIAAEFPPARWCVRGAARLVAPKHRIGAVGVVFDDEGRVLIVEHAFRTDYPWGLPGGWVETAENPADAVARELREELKLDVEVGPLVLCGTIGRVRTSTHPVHLGLAYACRLRGGGRERSLEVLAYEWIDPATVAGRPLAEFQRRAIIEAARLRSPKSSPGG
jgi:ADP-ribose pyrophosphatase YjhB (NUDIX family)